MIRVVLALCLLISIEGNVQKEDQLDLLVPNKVEDNDFLNMKHFNSFSKYHEIFPNQQHFVNNVFGKVTNKLKNINVLCSGGGIRATIGCLAGLNWLKNNGVDISKIHFGGLSGGSWVVPLIYQFKDIIDIIPFISQNSFTQHSGLEHLKLGKMQSLVHWAGNKIGLIGTAWGDWRDQLHKQLFSDKTSVGWKSTFENYCVEIEVRVNWRYFKFTDGKRKATIDYCPKFKQIISNKDWRAERSKHDKDMIDGKNVDLLEAITASSSAFLTHGTADFPKVDIKTGIRDINYIRDPGISLNIPWPMIQFFSPDITIAMDFSKGDQNNDELGKYKSMYKDKLYKSHKVCLADKKGQPIITLVCHNILLDEDGGKIEDKSRRTQASLLLNWNIPGVSVNNLYPTISITKLDGTTYTPIMMTNLFSQVLSHYDSLTDVIQGLIHQVNCEKTTCVLDDKEAMDRFIKTDFNR